MTFEQYNEGLFTKPKLKYKVGDYVTISKLKWIESHIAPKMPPSFIAEIIKIDDRPLLKQYVDLKSKWIVAKRNFFKKDKIFPYIVEFMNGHIDALCDDDIERKLNQNEIEEYELQKSANKYNL